MKSGIYFIQKIGGKIYIGSSNNITRRLSAHKLKLKKGIHPNIILQNTYNKYGENLFKIGVLEFCEIDVLIEREQFYINSYNKEELFNIRLIVESNVGLKHTEEAKMKIGEASKGNQYGLGKKHSIESKMAISKAIKTRGITPEARLKMGAKRTENNKVKRELGLLKRSDETKAKIAASLKGRIISKESTEKMLSTRAINKLKKLELAA